MQTFSILAWTLLIALFPALFYAALWLLVSPQSRIDYAVMALSGFSALLWQVPRLRNWFWAARYVWKNR